MQPNTTINDVAREAGVSKVTVSYVMNGRAETARISEGTVDRVLEAARILNYTPNAIARTLATRRSETVAVVFQSGEFFASKSTFTSEVMRGVCDATVRLGFDVMWHTKPVENAEEEAANLCDGRVDGALILRDQDHPTYTALARRNLPYVQFFTRSDDPTVPYVDADNVTGGRLAARHLLELGHRRMAVVRGPTGSVNSQHRVEGFVAECAQQGVQIHSDHVIEVARPTDSLETLLALARSSVAPTAVFVWSDDVAFECLKAYREVGLRVPRDISIVGFDSLDACEISNPPLTSIHQPIFEMAATAVEMLVKLLAGEQLVERQVLFSPNLEVRASTRAVQAA